MALETDIFILTLLLFFSAFFSGVETALFSLSPIRVKHLLKEKRKGAVTLNSLKENPQRLLITILIGNNIVNIGASAFATVVAIGIFGDSTVGVVTGVMTLLILIFGEIIPKSLATRYNQPISLLVAKPIKLFQTLLIPLVLVFEFIVIKFTGQHRDMQPAVTERELLTAVSIGEKEGQINSSEKEMIHNIFQFDDIDVENIMTPLAEIFSIDAESKLKDVVKRIIDEGYSRVPVYTEDRSNIIGVLLLKDAMEYIANGKKKSVRIAEIMQMPLIVPDNKKVDKMLRTFQRDKQHMAVVVDEHGAVRGIVTIEDVLEEIVGEIVDETDKIEEPFKKLSDKTYMIQGGMEIDDFKKIFKLKILIRDFDTVSGYITSNFGRLPKPGEEIKRKKFSLIVREIENNKVKKAKLILK